MESSLIGKLNELISIIRSKHPTKRIGLNSRLSGSFRKIYICKDCELFRAKVCKRQGDAWEITELIEEHGRFNEDGLIQPCTGSRRPSTKDVEESEAFEALINSRKPTDTKLSIDSIASTIAESLPMAHCPTVDVVKKAIQATKRRRLSADA